MNFDEQLTHAFETLTERLRGEIDHEVGRRTAEAIAAAAPVDPPPVAAAVTAAAPAVDAHATDRLAAAFAAIDRARSLTAVLDTLLSSAREESLNAGLWLIRAGRLHQWRAADADDAGEETPAGSIRLPIIITGTEVACLCVDDATPAESSELRTQHVELLARYAGKSLEALTAFKTARALTHHDDTVRGLVPGGGRGELGGSRNAEDEPRSEEDTSARRYARLLVSEIKLYHEPALIEGRRDRDLATRLGGEIARARAMYEQRVPRHVRDRVDYFQDELVKTLANGDASLLEVRISS